MINYDFFVKKKQIAINDKIFTLKRPKLRELLTFLASFEELVRGRIVDKKQYKKLVKIVCEPPPPLFDFLLILQEVLKFNKLESNNDIEMEGGLNIAEIIELMMSEYHLKLNEILELTFPQLLYLLEARRKRKINEYLIDLYIQHSDPEQLREELLNEIGIYKVSIDKLIREVKKNEKNNNL